MSVSVKGQPWLESQATRAVMRALEAAGGAGCARFVGGCVRNSLLGQPVDDIDIAVTLTSLDQPATVNGAFTYGGERFETALTIASPRALQKREPSAISLTASGGLFKASADGTADPAAGRFQGKASAEGASLKRLAAFGGAALPDVQGFGPFAVSGNLQTDGSTTRFTGATVKLDAITGTGDLMVNTAGKVPALDARLTLDQLDVNPYLAGGAGSGTAAAEGVNVEQGWSDAPIDLSGLKALDAQVQLTTGKLTFQKMSIDRAAIDLAIKGGALTATLRELALYGGTGTGRLAVDAGGRVQTVLDVAGIQAKPLLTDAVGLDNIEGQGKLAVNVTGSGRSQRAIMASLGGTASFLFSDGAISGINLAAIARTVESALSGEAVGPAAKTDFAEVAGSFRIANGLAATDDLRLLNPFIRVTGKGIVNIAQQSFDLRLEPRAVGTREGQGGAAALGGIGVPFRVTGPWTSPSFAPDLEGLVTDQLQNILGGQGGDGSGNPLGGLIPGLGGQPAPQGQEGTAKPEEKKEPDPVGDLLRGLGGR